MATVPIVAGIDDFATGGGGCVGCTYFLVPERYLEEFEAEARALLKPSALPVFHGKEYKRRFEPEYKAFLELIAATVQQSLQCTAIHVLYRNDSLLELRTAWNRIVLNALKATKVEEADAFNHIQPFLDPIFTLMQACSHVGPYSTIRALIDDNNQRRDPSTIELHIGEKKISASTILRPILNGWRTKNFPRTPTWERPPLTVRKASESMLIQAADVIANFSLAYAQAKLGRMTKSSAPKVRLLEDAFGKFMSPFPFNETLELTDDGFAPKVPGAVKWCMGWKPVEKPHLSNESPAKEETGL